MNIDEKLKEFNQSLEDIVNKDYKKIEEEVEKEISQAIEQELSEYEAKKQVNYDKNVQKIEKDYNKKVFNYEMNCKKEIIDEEKKLKNQLKQEAIKQLEEFTQTDKYQDYLCRSIDKAISLITSIKDTSIGITQKDMNKYENFLKKKYDVQIKEISAKYIGGCILENENQGIFIDNTLLNSINENIDIVF